MSKTKCNNCIFVREDWGYPSCALKYEVVEDEEGESAVSYGCGLIAIVTKEKTILPERMERG